MSNLLVNKQSSDVSYQASNYAGSYQFVSLHEIIANFMIAYVGEDKLISKISQLDVEFHANELYKNYLLIHLDLQKHLNLQFHLVLEKYYQ